MKTTCDADQVNAGLLSTVTVTLKDLENETLVLGALGYLGALIQVVKLSIEQQVKIINTLTTRMKVVKEKNQSRKLMWSLANIPLDSELPVACLEEILEVTCTFLTGKPVSSVSTVCESLNTLINISLKQKDFFVSNLPRIFPVVFPWLFYETPDRIRELSLQCLKSFSSDIASKKLIDTSIQADLKTKYYVYLKGQTDSVECLTIWGFIVECFGKELHESVSLLNELLKIEETALKSKNAAYRQVALEHWRYLIDCFALNPIVLNNSKRIKLMLVPLKSTDTKTIQLSQTKIDLWWYVLNKLGPDASSRFQEVVLPLLTFCFGSKEVKGQTQIFPDISPLTSTVLAGILCKQTSFECGSLNRSYSFLDQKDFDQSFDQFGYFFDVFLSSEQFGEHQDVCSSIVQSFTERCTTQDQFEVLNSVVQKMLEMATTKPSLMEVVFGGITGALSNDQLVKVLVSNVASSIKWYVENEPMSPTHPLIKFLLKLFNKGVVWDLAIFSTEICRVFSSLDSSDCLADIYGKFASALISSSEVDLSKADVQSVLLPLSWNLETVPHWSQLVSSWAKADASIIDRVLNPKSLKEETDVDLSLIKFVLKAVNSDVTVSAWIRRWTKSWMDSASVSSVQNF